LSRDTGCNVKNVIIRCW